MRMSNKQKAMGVSLAPNEMDVRYNNVNMHIQIRKKNLDGKNTVTYTLCDNNDGENIPGEKIPIEYSDLKNFTEKCLEPALEKAGKALA